MTTASRIEEALSAATTGRNRRCRVPIFLRQLHGGVEPAMLTVVGCACHERRVMTEPCFQGQVSRAGVPRTGDSVVPVDHHRPQTLLRKWQSMHCSPFEPATSQSTGEGLSQAERPFKPPPFRTAGALTTASYVARMPTPPSTYEQQQDTVAYFPGVLSLDVHTSHKSEHVTDRTNRHRRATVGSARFE